MTKYGNCKPWNVKLYARFPASDNFEYQSQAYKIVVHEFELVQSNQPSSLCDDWKQSGSNCAILSLFISLKGSCERQQDMEPPASFDRL